MRSFLGLLLLLPACAATPSEDPSGSSESAILGGKVEDAYPAVGMLPFTNGEFGSGTLVDPHWVLTAAHVGQGYSAVFVYGTPPAGHDATRATLKTAPLDRVEFHPCWARAGYTRPASCPSDPVDIALMHVKTAVTDVAPLPLTKITPEWFLSQPCVAVGFGAHLDAANHMTSGTRRSALSTLKSVGPWELQTERDTGIATSGDSGSPLLCAGTIVGTVRGSAGAIPKSSKYERTLEGYERTDVNLDWLHTTMGK